MSEEVSSSSEAETEEAKAGEGEPEMPEDADAGESGAEETAAPSSAEEPAAEGQDAGDEAKDEEQKADPDWKDMYARTLADFDNYRKRAARDREELVKFATSEAVKDMLPTVDNLALALDQAKDKEDPFVKGVRLAYEGFLKALKEHGAEPFESLGEVLDPNRHEAIATLPSETVEEGKISTEVKKGWMLNGRLLRAAQVVVSSGKGS